VALGVSGPAAGLCRLGAVVFGIAMTAFAVQSFVFPDGVFGLSPFPSWLPAPRIWSCLGGLALLASGLGLVLGKSIRGAAAASGVVLGLWLLLLHLPRVLTSLHDGGRWTTACETLALCSAAWVLAGAVQPGRLAFAATLLVFATLHHIYAGYVASVIPAWIPGHVFWTYATALGFVAAGVSIATGVQDRLGATLLGAMFACWVVMLHLPRAVAASGSGRPEWTSLFIALAMSGSAWIIAATPKPAPKQKT
jgi:hypothetical protein